MSHDMLSPNEYKLLTSQNSKIKGISEYKSRIIEKADDWINCLRIIARSETVDQEFKDKVFSKDNFTGMINNLIQYDDDSTAIQESNKQAITLNLMEQCLRYFQDRYKEVFIKKEIKTFEQFAKDITEFTEKQEKETRAQELFKTRQSLTPPLQYPSESNEWKITCLECYKMYDYGKNEDDVIKKIRHTKNCSIHAEKKRLGKDGKERIKWNYYRIIPPKKPKKLS